MKKVLFVISTLNTGGAQRIFSNIIMALPSDWKIDILLNDSQNIVYPYKGRIIDLGISPEENKENVFYQIKVLVKRFFKLRNLKATNKYDACISAMASANIVNVLTGKSKCRCILTVHGAHSLDKVHKWVRPVVHKIIRSVYKKADKIITVSQGVSKVMNEKFGVPKEKMAVIYNGYDVKKIREEMKSELEVSLPWENISNLIITVGRLEKIKGQWHLIKAFSEVIKKIPDAKLIILGEGQLRSELEHLIEYYQLENSVFMGGFVKNPYPYLKQSKLFVLTSMMEGLPNGIIEAMSCGVPCISVDCKPGAREIFSPEDDIDKCATTTEYKEFGVLCPEFNSQDLWDNLVIGNEEKVLAETIVEMLSDDKKLESYRKISVKRAMDFDMSNIIQCWLELCQ